MPIHRSIRAATLGSALLALLTLLSGAPLAARAQVLEPFPELLDEALGRPAPGAGAAVGSQAPIANAPPRVEQNAREIAQRFPKAQQAAMQSTLAQSLEVYQKLEAKFGWPRNDVAGAVAAFLVGNYMVMKGAQVADEDFVAVAQQLRASPQLRNTLGRQSPQALRDFYEQQAMVGTFMALAQMSNEKQPLPADRLANLRDSARANLRMALKRDPSQMTIGPAGMTVGP